MDHILNDPLFWLSVENSSYRPAPDARMRLDLVGGGVLFNTKESKWHKVAQTTTPDQHKGRVSEMGYTSYTLRFHWPRKFAIEATYYSSILQTGAEREKTTGRIREVLRVYPQFNEPPVLTLIGKTDRSFVEEALMYIKLSLK